MPTPFLNPIDYTSRDFSSLFADLQAIIPDILPEWTSRDASDMGIVLLELFAYIGDITNYYIDRVMNEAFLGTAQRRQSVLYIAQMLNYTPVAMRPAMANLVFTIPSGAPTLTVPAGTQVSTVPLGSEAPIIFETDTPLIIQGVDAATPTYVGTVSATQGETHSLELVGISTATISQVFPLYHPNVVESSVQVLVDEGFGPVEWTFQANLINAGSSERSYTLEIDENNVTSVVFGDNVNGRIPIAGAQIQVTYRTGNGFDGNVQANLLTALVHGDASIRSVTNPGAASGGVDIESTASMRTSIPNSFKALQRAVTLDDYAALALQVPGAVKANADASVYTAVTVYVAPSGGGAPSTALLTAVQLYVQDRALINTSVTTASPTYAGVNVDATVNVDPTYSQNAVKLDVQAALAALLSFTNVDFAQTVTVSSVYAAIQSVPGVLYASLTLLRRSDDSSSTVVDCTMAIDEIPVLDTVILTMNGGI